MWNSNSKFTVGRAETPLARVLEMLRISLSIFVFRCHVLSTYYLHGQLLPLSLLGIPMKRDSCPRSTSIVLRCRACKDALASSCPDLRMSLKLLCSLRISMMPIKCSPRSDGSFTLGQLTQLLIHCLFRSSKHVEHGAIRGEIYLVYSNASFMDFKPSTLLSSDLTKSILALSPSLHRGAQWPEQLSSKRPMWYSGRTF